MNYEEARPRELGRKDKTGEGRTPAARILRSGDPDVPGATFPPPEQGTAQGPAAVGLSGTGEPDEVPLEDEEKREDRANR